MVSGILRLRGSTALPCASRLNPLRTALSAIYGCAADRQPGRLALRSDRCVLPPRSSAARATAMENRAWPNLDVPSRSARSKTGLMPRGCSPFSAAAVPRASGRHAGTTHVVRQALWSLWELPRLPRPLVQGRYPVIYPWSAAARAAYEANAKAPKGGRGLVLEHVRPRNILIGNVGPDGGRRVDRLPQPLPRGRSHH